MNAMTLRAKSYSRWIQVQRDVILWLQCTCQVACAAAVAAAYFKHFYSTQIRLGGDVMIKLNARHD